MRLATVPAFGLFAYCLYLIAAMFEPIDRTKQWTWRIVFGSAIAACMAVINVLSVRLPSKYDE
jgi:hypothetical protein